MSVTAELSASSPNVIAAPITELVSCIASAANAPKSYAVISKCFPIRGRKIIANALKKKIIPRDISISFGVALMIFETAAIAVAPQIAVPDDIKIPKLTFIFKTLAKRRPMTKITIT